MENNTLLVEDTPMDPKDVRCPSLSLPFSLFAATYPDIAADKA